MRHLIHKPIIHLLLIGTLGFLVYSNTFHSPFQWDEAEYMVGSPAIKDLAYFTGLSDAPGLNVYAFRNRYIGFLTFALNYRLHGFDVAGYHIVNLAIHLINAILVYFLVALTFRTPYFNAGQSAQRAGQSVEDSVPYAQNPMLHAKFVALAVALLFVSHPVQTEAVTYVFQRFASLVSMFYLLSLVLYIKARLRMQSAGGLAQSEKDNVERAESMAQSAKNNTQGAESPGTVFSLRGPMPYALCALLFAVLAMKTKENAFTLPVVITLYEFLFFGGKLKKRLLRLLPFLLTMLIIPVTIIQIEGSFGEIMKPMTEPTALGSENLTRMEYFITQFRVIPTYIRLLLLPANQNVLYDYPVYRSFLDPEVLLSFIFLAALFGAAVYLAFKTQSAVSSKKLVVSSKKDNTETDRPEVYASSLLTSHYSLFTSEYSLFTVHYSRLIAFGILWFFITLSIESSVIPLAMVIDEYRVYLPSVGFFLAVVAGAVLLVNSIAMHRAKRIGQSEKNNGSSVRNAMRYALCAMLILVFALASATYARNTLWADKVSLWEDVVRKNPNSPKVYNNLGIAYFEKGHYEKAIGMYQQAISLSPGNFFAYSNLGVAYAVTGRTDMAIESFSRAIALDPNSGVVHSNLGHALRKQGRFIEAVEVYLKAVILNPYSGTAFYGLGSAYAALGRLEDAFAAFRRSIELSPNNPEAYRERGIVYAKKGEGRNALADFQKACALGSREGCEYLRSGRFH